VSDYWKFQSFLTIPRENHYRYATRIIFLVVQKRKDRAQKALAVGGKPPKMSDTIGWMVEISQGKQVDYVAA
jgi:hypothetical protein